jgi:hypothetical protein
MPSTFINREGKQTGNKWGTVVTNWMVRYFHYFPKNLDININMVVFCCIKWPILFSMESWEWIYLYLLNANHAPPPRHQWKTCFSCRFWPEFQNVVVCPIRHDQNSSYGPA